MPLYPDTERREISFRQQSNVFSRAAEYRADKQAVEEGYGRPMVSALKKLAKDNFAHLSPSPINVVFEYSHPPLSERIGAIETLLENQ